MEKGLIIVIEANIAVGKSLLCKSLYKYLYNKKNVKLYIENMDDNILKLFLSDKNKYAWSTQLYMFTNRLNILKEAFNNSKECISIIDRGLLGDLAFTNMLYNNNMINKSEYEVYNKLRLEIKKYPIDILVYLDCNIENNIYRLKKRGNDNEINGYSVEYLNNLKNEHDKIIKSYIGNKLILNWNSNYNINDDLLPNDIIINIIKDINSIINDSTDNRK